MTGKFFLYDPAGDGFQVFPTAGLRDDAAKTAIENCLVDGSWLPSVFEISVGEVTGRAATANTVKRPKSLDENGEDEEGEFWDSDTTEKHDVKITRVNRITT
jgi:hypothetical protein